jgi:peptide/nickel transport system permease protein
MARYAIRRILAGLTLLFAMSILTFALFRLIPLPSGCLVLPCGPGTHTTDAQLRAAEHRLGTDQPVPVQYAKFIWRIVRHGSFGESWTHGPINDQLASAAPPTISVVIGGMIVMLILAIPLGIISAIHAGDRIDRMILILTIVGVALHPFLVGLFLRRFFYDYTHLTPPGGYCSLLPAHPPPPTTGGYVFAGPPGAPLPPTCGGPTQWAWHMVLPWLTFALFFLPLYVRMIRARVIETMGAQHVTAARARGASEARVLRSHVMRPALMPLVTMIGLELGAALMAAIYIETIYGLGGIGHLMVDAISGAGAAFGYDLPLLAALFFCIAAVAILVNLITDLLYGFLDPRVRLA